MERQPNISFKAKKRMKFSGKEKIKGVVTTIMESIRTAEKNGDRGLISVNLDSCRSFAINDLIVDHLSRLGYVSYLTLDGGDNRPLCNSIYIDMGRKSKLTASKEKDKKDVLAD